MKPLKIHYLQHVPFEGLGCIEDWAKEQQHTLSVTHLYAQASFPDVAQLDWLIVMGGPMGVHDEQKYSWLKAEKAFIEKAIQQGKTVIGICLGAQLIADVLGAKVYPNKEKEIGWFNVYNTEAGTQNFLFKDFPSAFPVFHWHGDTFDLPAGAQHLAYSEACSHQAFLYHQQVLGLQFHFEVKKESVLQMVNEGKDELIPGRYLQSAGEIIQQADNVYFENNQRMFSVLDALFQKEKAKVNEQHFEKS